MLGRLRTKVGGEDGIAIEVEDDATRKSIDEMLCFRCYGLAMLTPEPSAELRTIQGEHFTHTRCPTAHWASLHLLNVITNEGETHEGDMDLRDDHIRYAQYQVQWKRNDPIRWNVEKRNVLLGEDGGRASEGGMFYKSFHIQLELLMGTWSCCLQERAKLHGTEGTAVGSRRSREATHCMDAWHIAIKEHLIEIDQPLQRCLIAVEDGI
jgi:hypothetical protein